MRGRKGETQERAEGIEGKEWKTESVCVCACVCVCVSVCERERDTERERYREVGGGEGELGLMKDMTVKPCRSCLTCFCDILPGIHALTISFDDHLPIRDLALQYYDLNIKTSWILVADIRGIMFLLGSGSETSQCLEVCLWWYLKDH